MIFTRIFAKKKTSALRTAKRQFRSTPRFVSEQGRGEYEIMSCAINTRISGVNSTTLLLDRDLQILIYLFLLVYTICNIVCNIIHSKYLIAYPKFIL